MEHDSKQYENETDFKIKKTGAIYENYDDYLFDIKV